MLVNCDKCEKDFVIKVQEQHISHELHGEITRQFFVCPHCGSEFNVGFANAKVAALIYENVTLRKVGNRDARKQYNHNMQKIKKLSNKLESAWEKYHRSSNAG